MDDTRRQVLLAELEDAKRERERLTAFIETLGVRLGVDATAGPDDTGAAEVTSPSTQDPSSLIYQNEFVGMSLPKAAEAVLSRFSPPPHQRPLKTNDLVVAVRKGGLAVSDAGQLYRALHKHSRFHSLGRGVWGLASWYPDAVRAKSSKGAAGHTGPAETSNGEAGGMTAARVPGAAGERSQTEQAAAQVASPSDDSH